MLAPIQEHCCSFWQGNLDDFDHQLSPGFTDAGPPPVVGPQAAKAWAVGVRAGFPDTTVTVDDAVVEGDRVAVRARWRGTHAGPAMGREPTGRAVEFSGMVFWRFDEHGRIAERWAQIDFASM
jgi:predicted ester cyclase